MRYAIGLEYDGSRFHGWQIQRQEPTVQGCLEQAVAAVANHEARVTCSGRTDTGVHALCQVAHFDSDAPRPERSWILGLNSNLPAGISVLWIREVDDSFHARFSAFARSYRYVILNRWIRPALDAKRMSWCRTPLDADKMDQAARYLLGEHDFTSFRARACQARHAVREIQQIAVERQGNVVSLDVTANGFLYHMVRNIAGSLLQVGSGEQETSWVKEVLQNMDRTQAAPTAPPEGLYFLGARYPDQYGLPTETPDFPRGRGAILMVRVKICGLTRRQDVSEAVQAGADALGFVFADRSKRVIGAGEAKKLVREVPAFVSRVGLFMDQDVATVADVLKNVPLSLLQFHGNENAEFCRQFGLPYIKALSIADGQALNRAEQDFFDAAGLLLDSHAPGGTGGTGEVFDWSEIPEICLPLVLAGGLTPENVGKAVRQVKPWAVDVSSGVEDAPGQKSAAKMQAFINEAKREY